MHGMDPYVHLELSFSLHVSSYVVCVGRQGAIRNVSQML